MLPELALLLMLVMETALLRQLLVQATCEQAANSCETSQGAVACTP